MDATYTIFSPATFISAMCEHLNEISQRIFLSFYSFTSNLTVEEIAEIANVHPNTIIKGRKEIRKKYISDSNQDIQINKSEVIKQKFPTNERKASSSSIYNKYPSIIDDFFKIFNKYLVVNKDGSKYIYLSSRQISYIFKEYGIDISYPTVLKLLKSLNIHTAYQDNYNNENNTNVSSLETSNSSHLEDSVNKETLSNRQVENCDRLTHSSDLVSDGSSHVAVDPSDQESFSDHNSGKSSSNTVEEDPTLTASNVVSEVEVQSTDVITDLVCCESCSQIEGVDPISDPTEKDSCTENSEDTDLSQDTLERLKADVEKLLEKTRKFRRNKARKASKNKKNKRRKKQVSRKKGGGRKKATDKYKNIYVVLYRILEKYTYGDPEGDLLWSSKSLRKLANALNLHEINVSRETVRKLLKDLGYSTKKNKKLEQVGKPHPCAGEQMEFIMARIEEAENEETAVISIDCKNKEYVGNYKNNGADYCLEPTKVKSHDFHSKDETKVSPYGIYDIYNKFGFINIGISKDTAEFAVKSIENWWFSYGNKIYSNIKSIIIFADGGGSNSYNSWLFKYFLQLLADKIGLIIEIHHYPAGKSKYNKIEHQLFSQISNNWRGHPLTSIDVIINFIRATRTLTGLKVEANLDKNEYKTGIKLTKEQRNSILIVRNDFHGEWNYKIFPHVKEVEYLKESKKS